MEEKTKTNGKFIVIIIMLLVIIVALGCVVGYLILDKEENSNNSNIKNVENKVETLSLEDANDLIDKYYYSEFESDIFDDIENFEKIKSKSTISNLEEDDFEKVDCSNFSGNLVYDEEFKVYLTTDSSIKVNGISSMVCSGDKISYDVINEELKELFGNSNNWEKINFSSGFNIFAYNNNNEFEVYYPFGTGFTTSSKTIYSVTNQEVEDSKLIIEVSKTKFTYDMDNSVYKSSLLNLSYASDEINNEKIQESIINKYSDQMEKYEFTFFVEDEDLKLQSIKKR